MNVCDFDDLRASSPVPAYLAEQILRLYGFDVPATYGELRPWMRRAWERGYTGSEQPVDVLFLAVAAGACHANRKYAPKWVADLYNATPNVSVDLPLARRFVADQDLVAGIEAAGALGGWAAQVQFVRGLLLEAQGER